MKLKVLGTQSPYATKQHNCPGFLITNADTKILLDCGSGSHRLLNYPDDLKNLHVFLTHLHRDHYNDVFNIQYSTFVFHNQERIESPVNFYLPATPSSIYEDVVNEKNSFAQYMTINEMSNIEIDGLRVDFCKTHHPIETYAVKVFDGKNTIVYTSDTSFSAKTKLVQFAKDADLLICESSLLKSYGLPEINSHLTAEQAGIIAKEANVNTLMLTHFWPEESVENFIHEARNVFKNVILAEENMTIDLDFYLLSKIKSFWQKSKK